MRGVLALRLLRLLCVLALLSSIPVHGQGTTIAGSRSITGALGIGATAPATAGMLAQTAGANNITLQTLKRFQDTAPTGNFQDFQTAAAASVWRVDVTGSLATGSVPVQRLANTITNVATGATLACGADATTGSNICTQANTETAGTLTLSNPTGSFANLQALRYRITCTNNQTYAFGTAFRFSTDLPQPTTCAAGKTDYIQATWNSTASKWDVVGITQGF